MQELFKGGVNFLQFKRALACGVNSRAGRRKGNMVTTSYVAVSQPSSDVLIFAGNDIFLLGYDTAVTSLSLLSYSKVKARLTREWDSLEREED